MPLNSVAVRYELWLHYYGNLTAKTIMATFSDQYSAEQIANMYQNTMSPEVWKIDIINNTAELVYAVGPQ